MIGRLKRELIGWGRFRKMRRAELRRIKRERATRQQVRREVAAFCDALDTAINRMQSMLSSGISPEEVNEAFRREVMRRNNAGRQSGADLIAGWPRDGQPPTAH